MIVLNIVRRLLHRHIVFIAVAALVFGAFEFIIPAVIATLDLPELIGGVIAMLPPGIGTAMTEQFFGGLSPEGLIGFGWNHPVAHAAGTAVAVVLGARAVAGEVEGGTLELVLAQPVSRAQYLLAQVAFAGGALVLHCTAGLLGMLAGIRLFDVPAPPVRVLVLLAANFLLLLFALYAVTLLASAFGRDGGRALGTGFLVAVVSFLTTTVALLWPAAAFMEPWALHSWYIPRAVVATGTIATSSISVLAAVALVSLAGAFWRFRTRDVP